MLQIVEFVGEEKINQNISCNFWRNTSLIGFKGVETFDSGQVPSLGYSKAPNCWVLPEVTLTTIAVSLPNIEKSSIKCLMRAVNEALCYVRLLD